MKAFVIGLVVASMSASPVLAQCGTAYRSRAYSYSYSYPTYSTYSTYTPYVAPAKVVEKVVKEVAVAYPVYTAVIPILQFQTYGAQYVPPSYPSLPQPNGQPQHAPNNGAQPNGQSSELRQILDILRSQDATLKGLDARIRSLEERDKGKTAPKEKPKDPFNPDGEKSKEGAKLEIPDVKLVAKASCVMCHARGKEDQGGGFVLMEADGSMVKLTARQSFNVVRHVERGTMPPAKAVAAGKAAAVTDAGAAAVKEEMFRQQESRVGTGG